MSGCSSMASSFRKEKKRLERERAKLEALELENLSGSETERELQKREREADSLDENAEAEQESQRRESAEAEQESQRRERSKELQDRGADLMWQSHAAVMTGGLAGWLELAGWFLGICRAKPLDIDIGQVVNSTSNGHHDVNRRGTQFDGHYGTNRRGTHLVENPEYDALQKDKSPLASKLAKMELELQLKYSPEGVPWIKTSGAETRFGSVIMLNSVFLGIDVEFMDRSPAVGWVFWSIESCFLVIFVIEIYLRVRAEMPQWRNFFNGWGIFDSLITVFGCLDAWLFTLILQAGSDENPLNSFAVLRVFRLMRLARLIRVFRMFGDLIVLLHTLFISVKAVAWISLLIFLIVYIGSIILVIMLGQLHAEDDEDVDKFYGSLYRSMYSHFAIVTAENWPGYVDTALKYSPMWGIYFVLFVIMTNFVLVNLMVGIITENVCAESKKQEQDAQTFAAESLQFRNTLETLFKHSDIDNNGDITYEEVRGMLKDPFVIKILDTFGINIQIPCSTLQNIMHLNKEGSTTFDEFFAACLRLCGSKHNIHSLFVQEEVNTSCEDMKWRIDSLEERVRKATSSRSVPCHREPVPAPIDRMQDQKAAAAVYELKKRMESCEAQQKQVLIYIQNLCAETGRRRDSLRRARSAYEANGAVAETTSVSCIEEPPRPINIEKPCGPGGSTLTVIQERDTTITTSTTTIKTTTITTKATSSSSINKSEHGAMPGTPMRSAGPPVSFAPKSPH